MGRKVFVSYKYGDTCVEALPGIVGTQVRDYIDIFQELLADNGEVNKGEADGEDLSDFQDETIASKLRDKIYDSSITVVFISRMMQDGSPEKDQWIPWEIAYSLREQSRGGRTSRTNAVLAVVLPDQFGRYDYFIEEDTCSSCHCRSLKTSFLFQILRDNMFNIKEPEYTDCNSHWFGSKPYEGDPCYIYSVKWSDFELDVVQYLDHAVSINMKLDEYDIVKQVK